MMLRIVASLIAAVLLCAQTPMLPGFPPGTFQSRAALDATSGVAYTGPANAVASPTACFSLQACSSAKRGTKVANVCNSTGGTDVGCADMLSDASTGALVPQTISSISCPGANCTVKTLYDQTGSACSGPCDATQATVATRPTLTTSCGSLTQSYCMNFSGLQFLQSSATLSGAIAQPVTLSAVANRTSAGAQAIAATTTNNDAELFGGGAANQLIVYAGGTFATATATDAAWHSEQGVLNGASSVVNVDGVDGSAANSGAGGWSSGTSLKIGSDSFNQAFVGQISEVLYYPIAFAAPGNSVTMCHNQFTRWGTSTSC